MWSTTDIWTDPVAAGRPADARFAYRYTDLTTPIPTSGDCLDNWAGHCRITINYEAHIHPLWAKLRQTLDVDGITVLSDDTCTNCHAPLSTLGAGSCRPAQLDLTDGASDINGDHFKAYRELLSGDNEQDLVDGVLADRLIADRRGSGHG